MKKLLVTGLFLVFATGTFAYLYDGLNTNDCIYAPGTADSMHARAGFYYQGILNKMYNFDGDSVDDPAENYRMYIPIDVGYNFNNVAQLDIGLQLLKLHAAGLAGADDTDEFGLSDLWVKARGIFQVGPDYIII